MKSIAVVGSGFSGAVVARKLADKGFKVTVFESRNHIGGNCYTYRDQESGVLVHKYGPHIFHTDNFEVWNFINQFDEFVPYTNKVKAVVNGNVYTLPINLLTINQFFGKNFNPKDAKSFLENLTVKYIETPISFESQALSTVGKDLYDAFLKGYTKKQWGIDPNDIPASVLKRLPIRFNYDDNYFSHQFQGMPKHGYTAVINKILESNNIQIFLNQKFDKSDRNNFDYTFYSGPIDQWFNYSFGKLAYRTLDFETIREDGDFQGTAVINYCDENIPFTRITEHKHFAPWEKQIKTICFKEFSRNCETNDIPFYPVRLVQDKANLEAYLKLAKLEKNVSFLGRLGTYRYLDMDSTILEALSLANKFLSKYS